MLIKLFPNFGKFAIVLWLIFFATYQIYAEDHDVDYELYVNEITRAFTKQMKEEFNLYCYGESGSMPYDVEEIGLSFKTLRRATIDEARALNIIVTERLVQAINEHKKLRPYLREYPFPSERVTVSIAFYSMLNARHADGSVSYVSHIRTADFPHENYLYYDTEDPFLAKNITIFEEPYEEAERIVKTSGLQSPPLHQTTEKEAALDEVFEVFTKTMLRECDFKLWSIGGKTENGIEEIGAKFTILRKTSQDEARELIVFATETLLKTINNNEKLRPYLKEHPLTSSQIKMRLNFRKRNYYFYDHDSSLESAVMENNEIIFRKCAPNAEDEDIIIAREPYSEALKRVESKPSSKLARMKMTFWQRLVNSF